MWLIRVLLLAASLCVTPARAIVSTTDGASLAGLGQSFLDGVAKLILTRNDGTFGCSGSLVGGGAYILTAAHCLSGETGTATTSLVSVSFLGGAVTQSSTSYVVHPGWNGTLDAGNDLAVIQLLHPVTGISSYSLGANSAQGMTVVLAGDGLTGSGTTGSVGGTFGTLHYGYNQYDGPANLYPSTYLFDFDSGTPQWNRFGSTGLGPQEAMIASGDSGGPSLVQMNGLWHVVGVHSFDSCSRSACPVNSSFGEVGADMSTFGQSAWVQSVVIVAVPEPSTYAMMLAGLLLVGAAACRGGGSPSRARTGVPSGGID